MTKWQLQEAKARPSELIDDTLYSMTSGFRLTCVTVENDPFDRPQRTETSLRRGRPARRDQLACGKAA